MKITSNQEAVAFLNALEGYEGYVQWSDRPIEDVFKRGEPITLDAKEGFVYEAHFCNGTESITIRQLNDAWQLSRTRIAEVKEEDLQTYLSPYGKVRMAQIWESESDPLCEGMERLRLKRVVFAGFEEGGEV